MATSTATKGNNNNTQNSYFVTTLRTARVIMVATLFSLLLNLTSCSPDSVNPDSLTETAYTASTRATAIIDSNSTLKSVATFPIGAAFSSAIVLRSSKAYDMFLEQYNSKTVHAYMKMEPTRGKFDFKEQDYWVNLAQKKPMRLHGHCLVYHEGAPEWLTKFSGSTSDFEAAVKNHIQTVVGRYKGKIKSWDVINEVFYNSGAIKPTEFRQLYSSDTAYMNFIKNCFIWAHEADPDALLFYTDYGTEISSDKVKAIINMVNDFKRSGIPIHGFGSHMHISVSTPDLGISNSLRQLSTTGLQIYISELDIKLNPENNQNLIVTDQLLNTQRIKYRSVAMAYKQLVPKNQQYGITLWDFSDGDSWIVKQQGKSDAPCVFNANYDKKPAYYGLMEGLMN